MKKICPTCGKEAHDFEREEIMDCVPPRNVLKFGNYVIDKRYREALYRKFPNYTAEEVVGSFLGYNPNFPDESEWFDKQNGECEDDE